MSNRKTGETDKRGARGREINGSSSGLEVNTTERGERASGRRRGRVIVSARRPRPLHLPSSSSSSPPSLSLPSGCRLTGVPYKIKTKKHGGRGSHVDASKDPDPSAMLREGGWGEKVFKRSISMSPTPDVCVCVGAHIVSVRS